MEHFIVKHPVELIEALMSEVGYSTRTRARNALKRGEILVNGKTAFKGNDMLEPDTKVSILSKEEVEKQARTGGTGTGTSPCRTAYPFETTRRRSTGREPQTGTSFSGSTARGDGPAPPAG